MDAKINHDFTKTARNITNLINRQKISAQDFIIFYRYFQYLQNNRVINPDELISLAAAIMDADTIEEVDGITDLKDEVSKSYIRLLSSKMKR